MIREIDFILCVMLVVSIIMALVKKTPKLTLIVSVLALLLTITSLILEQYLSSFIFAVCGGIWFRNWFLKK